MDIRSHLPFALAWEEIARKLHLDEEDGEDLRPYFEEAMRIANPKAAFCRVSVRVEGNERVWLENTCFESPLLAKNLAACQEVYPYVVTCGRELYDLCQRIEDPIMRYWLEYIAESVLRCAMLPVFEEMRALYHTTARYTMNPGSLPEWPIENQKPLFALLGDVEGAIGVSLTPSMLMLPNKSGSGILFASKEDYSNCALCTRLNCPTRRAPYHGDAKISS